MIYRNHSLRFTLNIFYNKKVSRLFSIVPNLQSNIIQKKLNQKFDINLISYQKKFFSSKPEKFEFQAETKSLLDIVAKSLYSDKEVFIRELVSNASDALEKRRCAELSVDDEKKTSLPFELQITTDSANRKIVFKDTGIGMNYEDLFSFLGTIAKSGSKSFREQNNEKESAESIIGQFGVGFYSAFVVSEKVVVTTKKIDSDMGYTWTWDGFSNYQIEENSNAEFGTKIELFLREGEAEKFLSPEKVSDVINKYSIFVTVPIYVNGELVNTTKAIWTLNPNETTPEMHETFFKQLTKIHHPNIINDRPQYIIQYKTDAPINIRSLFYIPSRKVSHLEFASNGFNDDYGVSLYNRKVLIKSHAKQLLPHYLRFIIGVVDSEDIPLNLSREMLQSDLIIEKIRQILTDRIIKYFVTQIEKDRVKYNDFYQGYSLFFKEGIVLEKNNLIKQEIAKLLLFESSNLKAGTFTTLDEYINRMQTNQKSIYYLYTPSRQLAETSPYYEMFKSHNMEVLFIYEPADELVESIEQWVKNEGLSSDSNTEITRDPSKKEFLDWIKTNLGNTKVDAIKPINQTSEHPFIITVSGDMGAARHLLRITDYKEMEHLHLLKPILHVNFLHPVIKGIIKLKKTDEDLAKKVIEQVYDNALITAGLLKDSSQMVGRINLILGDLMKGEKSIILTP